MTAWGIVVSAGEGRRFGRPKHDAELGGEPLWKWARAALLEGGAEEAVVVGPMPGGVPGGERRRDSVLAGLAALPDAVETVLVHDAARPLATSELVIRVLERLAVGDVDGVVPAIPVRDTVKRVSDDHVIETVEREELVVVQTPQAFSVSVLRAAHEASDVDAPDDAALIERAGGSVAVVPGELHNIKITYPEDLRLAEALLP